MTSFVNRQAECSFDEILYISTKFINCNLYCVLEISMKFDVELIKISYWIAMILFVQSLLDRKILPHGQGHRGVQRRQRGHTGPPPLNVEEGPV